MREARADPAEGVANSGAGRRTPCLHERQARKDVEWLTPSEERETLKRRVERANRVCAIYTPRLRTARYCYNEEIDVEREDQGECPTVKRGERRGKRRRIDNISERRRAVEYERAGWAIQKPLGSDKYSSKEEEWWCRARLGLKEGQRRLGGRVEARVRCGAVRERCDARRRRRDREERIDLDVKVCETSMRPRQSRLSIARR